MKLIMLAPVVLCSGFGSCNGGYQTSPDASPDATAIVVIDPPPIDNADGGVSNDPGCVSTFTLPPSTSYPGGVYTTGFTRTLPCTYKGVETATGLFVELDAMDDNNVQKLGFSYASSIDTDVLTTYQAASTSPYWIAVVTAGPPTLPPAPTVIACILTSGSGILFGTGLGDPYHGFGQDHDRLQFALTTIGDPMFVTEGSASGYLVVDHGNLVATFACEIGDATEEGSVPPVFIATVTASF